MHLVRGWGNAAGEVANLLHGPIRTDRQTNTFPLTFTPTGDLELLSPDLHVFSLWEETRAATENPFRHAENIQALRLTAKETKKNNNRLTVKLDFCPTINQRKG